jgi:hypothetical protein
MKYLFGLEMFMRGDVLFLERGIIVIRDDELVTLDDEGVCSKLIIL